MAYFDLPLEDLRRYRSAVSEPADFTAFWTATLDEARALAKPPALTPTPNGLTTVDRHIEFITDVAGRIGLAS